MQKKISFLIAIVIVALLVGSGSAVIAVITQYSPDTVIVIGDGEVSKEHETVSFGLVCSQIVSANQVQPAQSAYKKTLDNVNKLKNFIFSNYAGMANLFSLYDLKTTDYILEPIYEVANNVTKLTYYKSSMTFSVLTRLTPQYFEIAHRIIEDVMDGTKITTGISPAVKFSNFSYGVRDPESFKFEALSKAFESALVSAKKAAAPRIVTGISNINIKKLEVSECDISVKAKAIVEITYKCQ